MTDSKSQSDGSNIDTNDGAGADEHKMPLTSHVEEFPRDNPAYWFEIFKRKREVAEFDLALEQQIGFFGDQFFSADNAHWDNLQAVVKHNCPSFPTAGDQWHKPLQLLNELRKTLNGKLLEWKTQSAKTVAEGVAFNQVLDAYNEAKKKYLHKLQSMLGQSTEASKLRKAKDQMKNFIKSHVSDPNTPKIPKEEKVRLLKQELEMKRIDIECTLQRIELGRERAVINPLQSVLKAYLDFFKGGYELLQPLSKPIDELGASIKSKHDEEIARLTELGGLKTKWESKVKAQVGNASDNINLASGIRDLDAMKGGPNTTAREKEGYLYTPSPNFCQSWCEIKGGELHIEKQGEASRKPGAVMKFPLMLCTAKELRDVKLKNVFTVISPNQSIELQAETAKEMRDWLGVIANATSTQLESSVHAHAGASSLHPGGGGQTAHSPEQTSAELKKKEELLNALRAIPGNDSCADCMGKNPEWLSINLGIMICMTCSGLHRSLGSHVSKVRSAKLDTIDDFLLATLQSVGNKNANAIWEATVKAKRPNQSSKNWVKAKYEMKSFLGREEGIDVNKRVFEAIENANPLELMKALAWGANPNWPNPDQENRSALHWAVWYGNTICVDILIQNNANLHKVDDRGWTPLHYAAYQDDLTMVQLLLLRGGNAVIEAVDEEQQTPFRVHQSNCPEGNKDVRALLAPKTKS